MGLESAALVRPAAEAGRHAGLAAAVGPLGDALAATPRRGAARSGRARSAPHWPSLPAAALASLTRDPAGDGAEALVVHPGDNPAHPGLVPLRADGIRTLVTVALVAQGRPRGVLLLAGRAERPVPIEDVELLELLAAHAATCLRTADLMRSLRERAETDPLTGLGHHATFHEALAGRTGARTTAVVVVDLDGFKRINDTYGHQHGDRVLRAIAAALSGALRRGDTLFRIGGDEFAALLAVADAERGARGRHPAARGRRGGAARRDGLDRGRGAAGGRDRRRAAGPRGPRALPRQGGGPRRGRVADRERGGAGRPRCERPRGARSRA